MRGGGFAVDGELARIKLYGCMMTLIRKAFWLALFLVFTLGFVTYFDHGFVTTTQFTADAKGEIGDIAAMWKPIKRAPDHSDDVPK